MVKRARNAAVETARGIRTNGRAADRILTVKGVRIKLTSVPAGVFTKVRSKIPEPQIPTWHNEEYDRDEPNPNNPEYLAALNKANEERAEAVIDACALFGIELLDGMPTSEDWLKKLQFMEKLGGFDLGNFNLADPFEKEFVFKRYYIATMGMIAEIQHKSAVTEEDVEEQAIPFRSEEEG